MPSPLAYLAGQFLPFGEASLSVADAGFVSGVTVTDFCRTYHRRLFRRADHLARFRRDCAACFIPLPMTDEILQAIGDRLVEHNAPLLPTGSELALVTFATPGPIGFYAGLADDGPATLGMHTVPLPAERYQRFLDEGVTLALAGHHAATPDDLAPPRVKHRSRLHWWRAAHLLAGRPHVSPGAIAVLLDGPAGHVTETAVGNLLVVRNGVVRTPPVGRTLDGISLGVVRELCAARGILFVEERLTPADCEVADEMMLAGTGFGLAGVCRFEATTFRRPGALTRTLMEAWADLVQGPGAAP